MPYKLRITSKFKKGLKLAKKRGLNLLLLEEVISKLQNDIPLEEKYRDHNLKGEHKMFRECHRQPDGLLVYMKKDDTLILTLVDTGSHADIFDM